MGTSSHRLVVSLLEKFLALNEREAMSDNSNAAPAGGIAIPLLLALVLGICSGFGYGITFGVSPSSGSRSETPSVAEKGRTDKLTPSADGKTWSKDEIDRLKEHIVSLEPVIANIDGNAGRWVRLEGWVAFGQPLKEGREAILAQISEDVMGYLRSTNLSQIESPAGLEFLKEDLMELVQLRTKGRARRFVLRTLVVE